LKKEPSFEDWAEYMLKNNLNFVKLIVGMFLLCVAPLWIGASVPGSTASNLLFLLAAGLFTAFYATLQHVYRKCVKNPPPYWSDLKRSVDESGKVNDE